MGFRDHPAPGGRSKLTFQVQSSVNFGGKTWRFFGSFYRNHPLPRHVGLGDADLSSVRPRFSFTGRSRPVGRRRRRAPPHLQLPRGVQEPEFDVAVPHGDEIAVLGEGHGRHFAGHLVRRDQGTFLLREKDAVGLCTSFTPPKNPGATSHREKRWKKRLFSPRFGERRAALRQFGQSSPSRPTR